MVDQNLRAMEQNTSMEKDSSIEHHIINKKTPKNTGTQHSLIQALELAALLG